MKKRMLTAFLIFAVIVLAVMWLFQTVLLDDIYRSLKLRELNRCGNELYECVVSGSGSLSELDKRAGELAAKNNVCISVYRINNGIGGKYGALLMEKHTNALCFIHNVGSTKMLNKLYTSAGEGGGSYLEYASIAKMFSKDDSENSGENVILVRLISGAESELMILINSELIPVSSTVSTLRLLLIYMSIIILALGTILALVLSSRISKPIREMSVEASKLALGNYNVNFDGGNCTETRNLSLTLNRAAYELSKLDKMQKDLVANVSHDLRTPLTMISGYAEVIRDIPGEATPENMQIVIDEAKRLTSLVNDMLEVSRYQGGNQKLNLTRFNITESIRNTILRYSKLVEHDGFDLSFEFDSDVYVVADENRILQVLYNLISNAINYTGEDKTVSVIQSVVDGKVTVAIRDTGCGIPEEELPLVWERYYKVNDFHKRANIGTGLGLSIVKNILLLHGARFGVKSTVGEGSTFWFELETDHTAE